MRAAWAKVSPSYFTLFFSHCLLTVWMTRRYRVESVMTKSRMASCEGSRPALATSGVRTHVGFEARTQSWPPLAPRNDNSNTRARKKVLLPGTSQRVREGHDIEDSTVFYWVEGPLNSLRSTPASSRFDERPVSPLLKKKGRNYD